MPSGDGYVDDEVISGWSGIVIVHCTGGEIQKIIQLEFVQLGRKDQQIS